MSVASQDTAIRTGHITRTLIYLVLILLFFHFRQYPSLGVPEHFQTLHSLQENHSLI